MTHEEFREFIKGERWTFAKTMRSCPHEYIVKDRTKAGQEAFEEAKAFILENGFPAYYSNFKDAHYYYSVDGRYYWVMGTPPAAAIIMNRCLHSDYRVGMRAIKKD